MNEINKLLEKRTIKCPNCSYLWETSSQKQFVTCPDCLNKINITDNLVLESKEVSQ